jgi:hypothetical protein
MPDARTVIERRTWRLAFLLTGNAGAATSLIDRINKLQKHPESLEPALLDRLIVQNSRGLPKARAEALPPAPGIPDTAPAAAALAAALSLGHQPLEAWMLKRIDDLDDLHIARAMDCSKTALRLHLSSADERLATLLGEKLLPSTAALRAYADALDPAPLIIAHREEFRRQRAKRLKRRAIIAAAALLLLAFAILKILLS